MIENSAGIHPHVCIASFHHMGGGGNRNTWSLIFVTFAAVELKHHLLPRSEPTIQRSHQPLTRYHKRQYFTPVGRSPALYCVKGDSWEDAAHRVRQAHVMAAPVVDAEGVLVAVLNPNDLLHEMEIEATDDIMRQSGSGGGESYFGTPLGRLVASRVGWLLGLLCLQSFSSLILQSFQNVIERNMVIALFLTMLTGTAGNAGNQVRESRPTSPLQVDESTGP